MLATVELSFAWYCRVSAITSLLIFLSAASVSDMIKQHNSRLLTTNFCYSVKNTSVRFARFAAGGVRVANPNYGVNNSGEKNVELAIPLKYLGKFWRALDIPLISCEVSLESKWNKDDEIKLLTNLKSGFTREIIWNKYRSQMTTEAINNNLYILIDPTFTNVNRLFVLAYGQNNNDRQSFSQFYLPKVMAKDYNVIIDKLAFFGLAIKTEEEA